MFDKRLSRLREPYVVFEPHQMTPAELHAGWWRALEEFYSLKSIAKRIVLRRDPNNLFVNLVQNVVYWSKVRRGVHPVYFDGDFAPKTPHA